jgi:hypothetical protein
MARFLLSSLKLFCRQGAAHRISRAAALISGKEISRQRKENANVEYRKQLIRPAGEEYNAEQRSSSGSMLFYL